MSQKNTLVLQNISEIGVYHTEKTIQVSGTVVRSSGVKSLAISKQFRCVLCNYEFKLEADVTLYYSFEVPSVCPNKCKSSSFESSEGSEEWLDYKEIKIQDTFAGGGKIPGSLWVVLLDQNVNACSPGDDSTFEGVLVKRWKPLFKGQLCDIQLCLICSSVETHTSKLQLECPELIQPHLNDEFLLRKVIVESFCSKVFGLEHVKLGLLLCMVGGVREQRGGLHLRGHCHCLLLGEPGTAKSTLLKEMSCLHSRGVFTNGMGASKAGLTLSAVKEAGEWMLEAGALVLADCGICCIDDLGSLSKEEMSEIYESMENQSISVAKAGMVCSVNTRTTVVAASRPKKNRFDFGVDVETNAGLPSPLLSRFDLVFMLLDKFDEQLDTAKTKFVLRNKTQRPELLNLPQLRGFLNNSRNQDPILTQESSDVLGKYFDKLRSKGELNVTIRHLESLLRLSQAHARLCQRDQVNLFDAVSVILLMETTSRNLGLCSLDPNSAFSDREVFGALYEEITAKLGLKTEIDEGVFELSQGKAETQNLTMDIDDSVFN